MTEKFACDPQEADAVARALSRTGSDIQLSLNQFLSGLRTEGVGQPVAEALLEFLHAATTTRTHLIESVGTAAGLFGGLSEGTLDLDQLLAARATQT
ncbi:MULTISPECIES: hypothetical protein [Streptomyces]|uniref:hypothetical protein n=1 Tax=Streptomyces TaxID=1883 RepID=UPI001677A93E|nr:MULTISPECIES: hypothetical protein [Streptomyces]MBK3526984.1 hypothetical protein [Streptomyces sp. MBT70]GGR96709.1 hypothetical protein GCM10010236_59150 [Streptomyces eurythermus]